MDQIEQLERLAEPIVAAEGLELVDLEYRREAQGWVLRLYIDRPGGVTLADCQEISHQFGARLEVEDLIPNRYTLEVSSPGLDRKLKKEADFTRFAGQDVKITTAAPIGGRRNFQGRLEGLQAGSVLLRFETGETARLPLDQVASARLKVEL